MFKSLKIFGALLAVTIVAGCTGTGTTNRTEINSLIQKADGNTVIVARNTGFAGSAPRIFVLMDGVQVAALGNNEVASFQASPGQHNLDLKFEGIDIGLEIESLDFINDPGKTQFFVVTITQKFASAQMTISEISPSSFAAAVN